MKKFANSTNRKSVSIRFVVMTAIVMAAAVFINALPNLTAQAESSGSFFGLAELFSSPAKTVVEQSFDEPASPIIVGTCESLAGGVVEVQGTAGTGTQPTGYPTLTAAFAAINSGAHTGTVAIDVCGDTTEPATTMFLSGSGSGAASYTTILIAPAGGADD